MTDTQQSIEMDQESAKGEDANFDRGYKDDGIEESKVKIRMETPNYQVASKS